MAEKNVTNREKELIKYKHTTCFALNHLYIDNEVQLKTLECFSIIVIINGQGKIVCDNNEELSVSKGDSIFLPACRQNITLVNSNDYGNPLEALRCIPPKS